MTLRTDQATEEALALLAAHDGVSKHEAAKRAILARAREVSHRSTVDEATDRVLDRWGDVLDRLGRA